MRIIRFTASWCGPCMQLSAMLKEIEISIPIEVVDIDEKSEYAAEFGIRSIPTLVMLDGNNEVKRKVGMMSKDDLIKWIGE